MQVNSIGIVGHGHFGKFLVTLAERFLSDTTVKVYSRSQASGGALFCSLDDVAACDVVVLAGSIDSYEAQLEAVLPLVSASTILVDVATVKKHTSDLFKTKLKNRQYVCCHPMFGPESYKKTNENVTGYRIVVTDQTLEPAMYEMLKKSLTQLGFLVIEMSADEHDRLLAESLFVTHYLAQTLGMADIVRTDIDTVSFGLLLDVVESVKNDSKLFHDVHRFNPYCEAVAQKLLSAGQAVYRDLHRHTQPNE